MKRTNKIKAYLARVLAVAMVITMAAPPAPAYALSYGDPAVIRFDPKEGPDLSHSNYINVPRDGDRIMLPDRLAIHWLKQVISMELPWKIWVLVTGRYYQYLTRV